MSRDMRNTVGASEVAAILNKDPFRTAEDVWRQKVTGERTPLNGPMLRGVCLESGLLDWFERIPELDGNPRRVLRRNPRQPGDRRDPRQTDVMHPNGWAAATLDGYLEAEGVTVEAKASSPSKKWNVRTQEHPLNYRIQCIWQTGVARASGLRAESALLIAGPMYGELWEFPIQFDEVLFLLAMAKCDEFMAYVKAGEPLPASWAANSEAA